jgi:hypothetical protein
VAALTGAVVTTFDVCERIAIHLIGACSFVRRSSGVIWILRRETPRASLVCADLYYASEFNTIANGTFVRITDGPRAGLIARAAGGALLGLTSCVPLEGCPGQVNVAENAFTNYTAEHPQPANGTLVEGVPSDTYWLFTNGEREPASAGSGAVAIDDGGLAFYPIRAPSSGNPGAGSTGTGTTSTSSASTGGGSTTSSPGNGGVLASHAAKPLTRAQKLTKAIRACDKLRSKRKREACIAAAERRYHQRKKTKR